MNATIAAILRKGPSWKWMELIGRSLLCWKLHRDKGEGRELAKLVKADTVLYPNSDWVSKFSLELHQIDSTDKLHVFRNLKLVNIAFEEVQGLGRNTRVQGISRCFQLKPKAFPVV